MTILALDLSTKTGWAILAEGNPNPLIDFGVFEKSEKLIDFKSFDFKDIKKVLSFIEVLCKNEYSENIAKRVAYELRDELEQQSVLLTISETNAEFI